MTAEFEVEDVHDPLARRLATEFIGEMNQVDFQAVKRLIEAIPSDRGASINELVVKTGFAWGMVNEWIEVIVQIQHLPRIHHCDLDSLMWKCSARCLHICSKCGAKPL